MGFNPTLNIVENTLGVKGYCIGKALLLNGLIFGEEYSLEI